MRLKKQLPIWFLCCSVGLAYAYECSMDANDVSQLNSDLATLFSATDKTKDTDGDGLSDWYELQVGTNPKLKDSDHDGMDDNWELANGLNPLYTFDAAFDADEDGYNNLEEYSVKTDPHDASSNVAILMVPIINYILS